MRHHVVIIFFVSLLCAWAGNAQTTPLHGIVSRAKDKSPIEGVMVVLQTRNPTKIISYAVSNAEGEYSIPFIPSNKQYQLKYSMMSFETVTQLVSKDRDTYNVEMKEKAIALKEVVIKSKSIMDKGDTVIYRVSAFAEQQDKSLADVLKRMPGIELSKSGQIKYNGIPINKFYIEGKDMLGDRYGLATNNISQEDVARIEVMENHQPIKALADISFSQNPAINIRLKEKAKSRYIIVARMGIGCTPLLHQGEISLMRFKKNTQTLNTYKTNNIGKDVTHETSNQEIKDMSSSFGNNYRLRDYLHTQPSLLTDLEENRSLFNNSHAISTNNLWGMGKNSNLSSQFTYIHHRYNTDRQTDVTDYTVDSTIITENKEHGYSTSNKFTGDLIWETNRSEYYLKNKFSTDIASNRTSIENEGTYNNTQTASLPSIYLIDDLHLIKRIGNRYYTLRSFNRYENKHHRLNISRRYSDVDQDIQSKVFFTNTHTQLAFYFSPFTLSMKVGVIGVYRHINSMAHGLENTVQLPENNLSMEYLHPYISPEISYKKGELEIKGTLPLSYASYKYHERAEDIRLNHQNIYFFPGLFIRYFYSPHLNTSLSLNIGKQLPDEQGIYKGAILSNYRNIFTGIMDFHTGYDKRVSWNVSYKNILKSIFANAGVSRNISSYPYVANRKFKHEYIIHDYLRKDNNVKTWIINGNISKGVEWLNGFVSLAADGLKSQGSSFQNNSLYHYTSRIYNITPKITSRLNRWCNLTYSLSYSQNKMTIAELNLSNTFNRICGQFTLGISPTKSLTARLTTEHYHNEYIINQYKHFVFTDIDVTYSLHSGIELNLAVNNLLGHNTYDYTIMGNLTKTQTIYQIRPRNAMVSIYFKL